MSYQRIKGTQDFYDQKSLKLRYVEKKMFEILQKYNYSEMITPIFENTELFRRSVGDDTDIVKKEMYTFNDKSDRSITLRPEGTASIVRSYLENKLYANSFALNKYYYFGPMFRYERPQSGRFRQFHQFGVEAFGESSYLLDADIIISAYNVFLNLKIKNIKLHINSIGDEVSRKKYAESIKTYFSKYKNMLCEDCNRRLESNPLRILDCKIDKKLEIMSNIPKISSFLTDESKMYFNNLIEILDSFKIPFIIDLNLVRGLDYYTDTVFEFVSESEDEFNGLTICAGGKYANLVNQMGGPNISGIGYAFGIERVISIMDKQNLWDNLERSVDFVIIGLDENAKKIGLEIALMLRNNDFIVDMDYKNTKLKPQFNLADKLKPKATIIIGENEVKEKAVMVKDSQGGVQEKILISKLVIYLKENYNK
ncbi:MAG: histidine--tRNA ligase [Bacilli bacterium]